MRIGILIAAMLAVSGVTAASALLDGESLDGTSLAQNYAQEVDRRLTVPETEQQAWASLLSTLLADKELGPQYVVLVDRNPFIQAVAIYWRAPDGTFHFIGASPVSTGKPGSFDHFITPIGVFEHTVANPDFRAEGTRNENGILGYGRRGMRVYDFGWQQAERGWGRGGQATMRLQMHATDPEFLERRLGTIQSKGCIRIPATLDTFIDRHAILDADYEQAIAAGQTFSVLSKARESSPWSGRYLVIIDTGRTPRRPWSPFPGKRPLVSCHPIRPTSVDSTVADRRRRSWRALRSRARQGSRNREKADGAWPKFRNAPRTCGRSFCTSCLLVITWSVICFTDLSLKALARTKHAKSLRI